MLIKEIDISCLMIHAKKIEEEKLKERAKVSKREKTCDGDFHILGCLTQNIKEVVVIGRLSSLAKVWQEPIGKFLTGTDVCFGCGKSGYKVKNYLLQASKGKDST
uniref:Gag-pol polyprotein n=1 Tax=Solanum tuberosum TaxID=4113 RepID=M1DSN2_SOLTU